MSSAVVESAVDGATLDRRALVPVFGALAVVVVALRLHLHTPTHRHAIDYLGAGLLPAASAH